VGFSRTLNEGDLHENITIYGQPDYGHLKVEQNWVVSVLQESLNQ
jgi:hypothetical protein